MTRACERCEWWNSADGKEGECRGAPPTPITELGSISHGRGVWPRTFQNGWCSRFKIAERLCGGTDARKRA